MGDVISIGSRHAAAAREAIAKAFDDQRVWCAAALVRTGLPAGDLESPLTLELSTRFGLSGFWRQAMAGIVVAWCGGRDEAVVRAFAAWDREGCELCALAALDGAAACRDCSEVG